MTDDPVALLREAADKAEGAPWRLLASDRDNRFYCVYGGTTTEHVADFVDRVNGPFIVAARNHIDAVLAEVVRLRAQVEAVRQIHQPLTEITSALGEPETTWTRCSHGCNPLVWPCPTIRALSGSNPVADAIDARIRNGSTGERRDLLAGYVEQEPDDD